MNGSIDGSTDQSTLDYEEKHNVVWSVVLMISKTSL
jgi:hypothetical protein